MVHFLVFTYRSVCLSGCLSVCVRVCLSVYLYLSECIRGRWIASRRGRTRRDPTRCCRPRASEGRNLVVHFLVFTYRSVCLSGCLSVCVCVSVYLSLSV